MDVINVGMGFDHRAVLVKIIRTGLDGYTCCRMNGVAQKQAQLHRSSYITQAQRSTSSWPLCASKTVITRSNFFEEHVKSEN